MRITLALLSFCLLGACAANEPAEPRLVPASRLVNPAQTDGYCFSSLTRARCDHDAECGFVAEGKRFDDRDACYNHYNGVGYQSLEGCKTSIDRTQLKSCIAAIESASCDEPMLDITDIDECHYGALCSALP